MQKIEKQKRQMPKQHCTRATKASKDTQDIKMTDNATTGEDSDKVCSTKMMKNNDNVESSLLNSILLNIHILYK